MSDPSDLFPQTRPATQLRLVTVGPEHAGWVIGVPEQQPRVRLALMDRREGSVMWRVPVEAPFEQDIELAVIDDEGVHALVFPCQRLADGWINAVTGEVLDIHPTHWRPWQIDQCDVSGLQ
ncbi:hypothetical protein [Rhizobium ecuadorense]|uniref:hypothetical protein n=1 Tax=Rhizobium ecuadorense TaxID=1671795 RepID=UPI000A8A161A